MKEERDFQGQLERNKQTRGEITNGGGRSGGDYIIYIIQRAYASLSQKVSHSVNTEKRNKSLN